MTYRLLRLFFGFYLRLAHGLRIDGLERVPATGPVVLCANHSSYFDSMLVGLCSRRPVAFLIHHHFYAHPLLGPIIRRCAAIPVTQAGSDRHALQRGAAVLAAGGVLGIFPEGRLSRTGRPGPGQPGAALLATASGSPIVPITIHGAFAAYPKGQRLPRPGRISVRVHPPLSVEPGRRRDRAYLRDLTARLMAVIAQGVAAQTNGKPDRQIPLQTDGDSL